MFCIDGSDKRRIASVRWADAKRSSTSSSSENIGAIKLLHLRFDWPHTTPTATSHPALIQLSTSNIQLFNIIIISDCPKVTCVRTVLALTNPYTMSVCCISCVSCFRWYVNIVVVLFMLLSFVHSCYFRFHSFPNQLYRGYAERC